MAKREKRIKERYHWFWTWRRSSSVSASCGLGLGDAFQFRREDFAGDITALVIGRNEEVAEMAKKVMKKLKEEVGKKGLKLSVTEKGKEAKSKIIASCGFLENDLCQFSREEGVTLAHSVQTLGVDLRTRVKRLGAKEKTEGEVQREVLNHKEEQSISKELHESGGQEVVMRGYDASKDLGSPCGGDVSHGEVKIKEANGGCCGLKEYDLPSFDYGSVRP